MAVDRHLSTAPPPVLDPWPGTTGGAYSPHWGENVRLFVWLAIRSGINMRWGVVADTSDQLDSGNVWSDTPQVDVPGVPQDILWADVSCDVIDLDTSVGATKADGPITRADAGTASVTLVDPERIYDPLNPQSPFRYQGRTRLMPGAGVYIWAETVPGFGDLLTESGDILVTEEVDHLSTEISATGVEKWSIFTGTVDSWREPWNPNPEQRRAEMVASDAVKNLTGLDRGAVTAVGAGDTTSQRIERVLTYYGWLGTRRLDTSTVTETATDMGTSAWDLIGQSVTDEIGYAFIDQDGVLQFYNRDIWAAPGNKVLTVGCKPFVDSAERALLEAEVTTADKDLANAIYAGRSGGATQAVRSQDSIDQFGERGLRRTDLRVQTDPQAAQWATFALSLVGYPKARVAQITLRAGLDPQIWPALLGMSLTTDSVRVLWTPPGEDVSYDTTGRAIGISHTVNYRRWETDVALAMADLYTFTSVLLWAPAGGTDLYDAGFVFA
jgi:hypothetical protein